jgi:RecA/RadA recombinase
VRALILVVERDPHVQRLERYSALTTGIRGLDEMIESGWLRGTTTLVRGPSGSGKTLRTFAKPPDPVLIERLLS